MPTIRWKHGHADNHRVLREGTLGPQERLGAVLDGRVDLLEPRDRVRVVERPLLGAVDERAVGGLAGAGAVDADGRDALVLVQGHEHADGDGREDERGRGALVVME